MKTLQFTPKGADLNLQGCKLIHVLTDTNKKIMLSNADVSLVRENFTSEKYNTLTISCKRSINSKNPDAKANEVIIRNY